MTFAQKAARPAGPGLSSCAIIGPGQAVGQGLGNEPKCRKRRLRGCLSVPVHVRLLFFLRSPVYRSPMGHNLSRERQDKLERDAQIAELQPLLVPGWTISSRSARIVEIKTVLGARQRGQVILLRCAAHDCRRRIEVDLDAAIGAGHADRAPEDLARLLACHHWGGCRLALATATYPHGVPLLAMLDSRALIAVTCVACGARLVLPPREMIARLAAAGRGDGATGLFSIGTRVRGPCRRCGRREFVSSILRPDAAPRATPSGRL